MDNPKRAIGFFKIYSSFNVNNNFLLEIKPIYDDLSECIIECFLDNVKVIANTYEGLL